MHARSSLSRLLPASLFALALLVACVAHAAAPAGKNAAA